MATDTLSRDHPRVSAVTYRGAAQVRSRYGGISDMTLWRWLHDEELGFPQPVRINGRRLWHEEALAAWERSRGMQGPDTEGEEPAVAAPPEEPRATPTPSGRQRKKDPQIEAMGEEQICRATAAGLYKPEPEAA